MHGSGNYGSNYVDNRGVVRVGAAGEGGGGRSSAQ